MELIPTIVTVTAAVELLCGLLFAFSYVRRSVEREYGLASIVAMAAAVHSLASLVAWEGRGSGSTVVAGRIAWLGLIGALAVAVHFALVYSTNGRPGGRSEASSDRGRGPARPEGTDGRPSWRLLAGPYGAAAVFAILDLRGRLGDASGVVSSPEGLASFGAGGLPHRVMIAGPLNVAAHISAVVAAAAILVIVARAYLMGRRESLAVVVGVTVLLATALNDVGVASGTFAMAYLIHGGVAALVIGIASTPSARYASVVRELDTRSKELRTRTRELRRSYEVLRAAQEELVKKEQLAAVGELAAVIAHEVRNPLAIIANAVAGLRRQAISRGDHETLLGILDEETTRLNRLVTDLLRYARPVNVQRQHLALNELLERALGVAKTAKTTIRVELKVEAEGGRIWGDANLLRHVFDNLIDNAVQAMGPTGTLTVRMRLAAEAGIDGLAVDIIDTGEGMDTQVRSRARDPFFTTRPSGTGLGLAIVDRIVEAHGGQFAIDSRAGEGTTVTVFLPHGSPSEPPASRRAKPPSDPPRSAQAE